MTKKRRSQTAPAAPESRSTSATSARPADRATIKKARRFLKDVERLLQKNRAKVAAADQQKVEAALQGVRDAIDGTADGKRLSTALKELDARTDQILGFAKKSTAREYTESIVVAVLIAVVLRAFVVEAFKIPTGSMIPTLAVGDHIFVNKFIYGLRVPLTNKWFVQWGSPERGDVIVFRYPRDLSKDYIKRIVAVSGDRVRVEGQDVFVNGNRLEREDAEPFEYVEEGDSEGFFSSGPDMVKKAEAFPETSQGTDRQYTVLYDPSRFGRGPFPHGQQLPGLDCTPPRIDDQGECTVMDDYLFVMGDNRDNSSDSRVWGGVPIDYVKGKAMFVWLSWSRNGMRWERIGHAVH